MRESLRACVWCYSHDVMADREVEHFVRCNNCGACGPCRETEAEAVEVWNEKSR